jgi:hypothetical protein
MTTDDILRNALHATAEASDRIVPGSGDHYRSFADEKYAPEPHTHQWKEVPNSERTDICRFACSMYRCAVEGCGEWCYV